MDAFNAGLVGKGLWSAFGSAAVAELTAISGVFDNAISFDGRMAAITDGGSVVYREYIAVAILIGFRASIVCDGGWVESVVSGAEALVSVGRMPRSGRREWSADLECWVS